MIIRRDWEAGDWATARYARLILRRIDGGYAAPVPSLADLARQMGVTPARARQLESVLISQLRRAARANADPVREPGFIPAPPLEDTDRQTLRDLHARVPCTSCGAGPGTWCTSASGRVRDSAHQPRRDLYGRKSRDRERRLAELRDQETAMLKAIRRAEAAIREEKWS